MMIDELIYRYRLLLYRISKARYDLFTDLTHEHLIDRTERGGVSETVASAIRMIHGIDGPKRRGDGIAILVSEFENNNDAEAAAALGATYAWIFSDTLQSMEWYANCVKAGGWWANFPLGRYLNSVDVDADFRRKHDLADSAEEHFQRAITHGHIYAKIHLARLHTQEGRMSRMRFWATTVPLAWPLLKLISKDKFDPRIRAV